MPPETQTEIPKEYQDFHPETKNETPEEEISLADMEKPEVKRSLNIFRTKVMRAMMLTGYLGVIEACSPTSVEDEIQKLPQTTISELRNEPDKFLNVPLLKTEGYPVFERRDRQDQYKYVYFPMGQLRYQHIDRVSDYYQFYEDLNKDENKSIEVQIDMGDDRGLNHALLAESKPLADHKFRIVGGIRQIDKDKYVLQSFSLTDLEKPEKNQ